MHSKERGSLGSSRWRFWDGSMDGSPLGSEEEQESSQQQQERVGEAGMDGMVMAHSEKMALEVTSQEN